MVICLENALQRIRSVADYQFGKGVGEVLFPQDVEIAYSKRTGRIRYVFLNGKRLATMRPMDGLFSLSIEGAKRILESGVPAKCIVTVKNDVSKFIAEGGDVFAVHVLKADDEIRPKDEVIVVNEKGEVLAVGKAVLSGEEMTAFKVGVAVKVRRGSSEEG
ncbi:MAG: PUA domain-containing protein [Candidatus Bathyarchaeia archaeon]